MTDKRKKPPTLTLTYHLRDEEFEERDTPLE